MTMSLLELWLPILLGTFLAWMASAVIHMALKYHNFDYQKLSNEDEVRSAVRSGNPSLGVHTVPYCVDMEQMQDEAMQGKFREGPVALVTVFPSGMPNMGKLVGQQIVYFFLGCVFVGYCATLALEPGAEFMRVFRFVATLGFLTFGWALIPFSIWYGHLWSSAGRYLLDALIYGSLVAGSFAWLWPSVV